MRELKFRVWTEFKTMVDVPTINFATSEAVMPDGEWYKVELMQWTGLTDKAGTRIYEGDIVQYNYKDGYAKKTIVVTYSSKRQYTGFNLGNSDNFEVIGNVYENKELLS